MIFISFLNIGNNGGGAQNSASFVHSYAEKYRARNDLFFCKRGSFIEVILKEHKLGYKALSSNRFLCLFQFMVHFYLLRPKVVFSIFGACPLVPWKVGAKFISGFAYSNIIQSEVGFWNYLPWYKYSIKIAKDFLRLHLSRRSDVIVLETEYLANLAEARCVFPKSTVEVVYMEPSRYQIKRERSFFNADHSAFKILMLCSDHPNKRIPRAVTLVSTYNKNAESKLQLIVTLPDTCRLLSRKDFKNSFDKGELLNVGPVDVSEVSGLISECDALINISVLESFSNNWVEAWMYEKPLISVDNPWCRSSLGLAALYFDVEDQSSFNGALNSLTRESTRRLVTAGQDRLGMLYSKGKKIEQYFSIFDKYL